MRPMIPAMLLVCGFLSLPGADTEVNVISGTTNQDGSVNEGEAKEFIPDSSATVGAPPYQIIQINKSFTPKSPFTFRQFRSTEISPSRVAMALKVRTDSAGKKPKAKWEFWLAQPKYVDIWYDPESAIVFGAVPSPFYSLAASESPTYIQVAGAFSDGQNAARFPLRCDGNYDVPPGGSGEEPHWAAKVLGPVDLDIDSDNTSAPKADPSRDTVKQDRIEDDPTKLGKIVPILADSDSDGVPDFADGYDLDSNYAPDDVIDPPADAVVSFVPLILRLPSGIDLSRAKIKFVYPGSDPATVTWTVDPITSKRTYNRPGSGQDLRIWKKNATDKRDKRDIGNYGDYVTPELVHQASDLGTPIAPLTWRFWIEAINPGANRIEVQVDPGSGTFMLTDAVRMRGVLLDIRTDVNRDMKIDWDSADDVATKNMPFRFWINDNSNVGDYNTSGNHEYEDSVSAIRDVSWPYVAGSFPGPFSSVRANNKDSVINGRCDLIDQFPVAIRMQDAKIIDQFASEATISVRLRNADSAYNCAWSTLSVDGAGDYLTKDLKTGFGKNLTEAAESAHTTEVTADMPIKGPALDRLKETGELVGLVECTKKSEAPIYLELLVNKIVVGSYALRVKTDEAEKMYRWINIRNAATRGWAMQNDAPGPDAFPGSMSEPANLPDSYTKDRYLMFIHGLATAENEASGNCTSMFKRFYRAGSNARFIGLSWFSNDTRGGYYRNVCHAFESSSYLHDQLAAIHADKLTIMAHSLGNMLTSSLICDQQYIPRTYIMFNAAIPGEVLMYPAPGGTADPSQVMINPDWRPYSIADRVYASNWYKLWPDADGRGRLDWRNRFAGLGATHTVNCYSVGDEVLDNWDSMTSLPVSSNAFKEFWAHFVWTRGKDREWVWYSGQIEMGRWASLGGQVVGLTAYAGWQFGDGAYHSVPAPTPRNPFATKNVMFTPTEAQTVITDDQLRTNHFFSSFSYESEFQSPEQGGMSAGDYLKRAQTLAESIPAMSRAVGRNNAGAGVSENFNMPGSYGADWPSGKNGRWHHADVLYVAYLYCHRLVDAIVKAERLK